jgi:hypothetical protein
MPFSNLFFTKSHDIWLKSNVWPKRHFKFEQGIVAVKPFLPRVIYAKKLFLEEKLLLAEKLFLAIK